MKLLLDEPIFHKISEVAETANIEAYVVGGYVRDLILQRPSKDIDILVVGEGILFARMVADSLNGKTKLSVFKNFGTANLKTKGYEIEFVGARKESYRRDSRKPIVEKGTLEDDLRRRDFTINALAINLKDRSYGEVIDLFDGLKDLEKAKIRTPLEPDQTFSDDPLRMMRAVRFAAQLQFELAIETFHSIKKYKHRLEIISQERITEELNKIILSPKPSIGLLLLDHTELLEIIFPELAAMKGVERVKDKAHKDNFLHSIKVLDNIAEVTDNLWLRWAALLHDIGKPSTKKYEVEHGWTFHGHEMAGAKMVSQIFRRMKLPLNDKMKYVKKLVKLHLRPIALANEEVSDSAVRRLIVEAGNDIDDLLILCKADITSKNAEKVKRYIQRFDEVGEKIKEVEEKDQLRNWKNPVSGEEIMETFSIPPSKIVGDLKHEIKEAILNGDIPNNYKAAREYMIKKGKEMGFEVK